MSPCMRPSSLAQGKGNGVASKHLTFVADCAPAVIATGKKMSTFA